MISVGDPVVDVAATGELMITTPLPPPLRHQREDNRSQKTPPTLG